ncbi:MAG: nucleotidyltransferase domain-containing protein [Deltaproteobacteria bacterium]|nr:nucleotidyltransferase domain-containing protein [Deltaproteobacteria bacterium]
MQGKPDIKKDHQNLPRAVSQAVADLKRSLEDLYGERLQGLYLYGSYARGDFTEDSDVDLLVALAGEVNPCREIDRLSPVVSDLCLDHDVLLAVLPAPADWVASRKSPLYERVRREGAAL